MNDDFSLLFSLLDRPLEEIAGRASMARPADLQKRLAKLAAGQCNDEERGELVSLLKEQPDLVPLLAKEIKRLRDVPKSR